MSFRHYPIPRSFYLALSLSESINIARQLFLEFTSHNIEQDNIKDAEVNGILQQSQKALQDLDLLKVLQSKIRHKQFHDLF